jgi:hypothetical protein
MVDAYVPPAAISGGLTTSVEFNDDLKIDASPVFVGSVSLSCA